MMDAPLTRCAFDHRSIMTNHDDHARRPDGIEAGTSWRISDLEQISEELERQLRTILPLRCEC